jgi:hypothetical protein
VFFAATKLFQARDPHLRRMVYLCIKDICPGSDEVPGRCNAMWRSDLHATGRVGVWLDGGKWCARRSSSSGTSSGVPRPAASSGGRSKHAPSPPGTTTQ